MFAIATVTVVLVHSWTYRIGFPNRTEVDRASEPCGEPTLYPHISFIQLLQKLHRYNPAA